MKIEIKRVIEGGFDGWVAIDSEKDLVAQGKTEEEAFKKLLRVQKSTEFLELLHSKDRVILFEFQGSLWGNFDWKASCIGSDYYTEAGSIKDAYKKLTEAQSGTVFEKM